MSSKLKPKIKSSNARPTVNAPPVTSPVPSKPVMPRGVQEITQWMNQQQWTPALAALEKSLREPQKESDAERAERIGLKAVCLFQLGQWPQAQAAFEEALALYPQAQQTRYNYAYALQLRGMLAEADPHYEYVLQLNPVHEAALGGFCAALEHRTDGLMQIEALCKKALAIKPDLLAARIGLAQSLLLGLRQTEGLDLLETLVRERPTDLTLLTRYYMYSGYSDKVAPERFAHVHRSYGRLWQQRSNEGKSADRRAMILQHHARRQAQPGAPLRVGILSSEAFLHPIGQLLASFVGDVDPQRAQVYLYATAKTEDEVTAALKQSSAHYIDVKDWTDEQLKQRIQDDGIDIVVDANGITGQHRLSILAGRCAPVQLAWAGYVYSTGLPTMDGYIADATTSAWPAETYFSEPVYKLPECVYCYRPVMQRPDISPSPALRQGFVTFGSYNNLAKVNTTTLDLWASVMRAVPNSRLAIKAATLGDADTRDRLAQAFMQRGVAPDRLMIGRPSLHNDFLEDFARVDIMLECVPFNGGMTTLEGLWQGVPLLAIEGQTHASRVGMSIMRAMGLHEWITHTPQEYVQRAVQLASQPQALAELRAGLRKRAENSALGDSRRFAAHMVAVWEDAWRQAVKLIEPS